MRSGLGMVDGLAGVRVLSTEAGVRSTSASAETEVTERPVRRKFGAEYKLMILREADACTKPGEIGALLRREGLYSSHLTTWRRQRDEGALARLTPVKRGPKARQTDARDVRIRELEKENEKLKKKMKQAEIIIEFQKKASEILGIPLGED